MLLNIRQLMDDAKCYEVVRELRWPDGVKCPACDSGQTFGKRGFRDHQAAPPLERIGVLLLKLSN
jgi:hypothetical protein